MFDDTAIRYTLDQIDAIINGPDSYCTVCDRPLYGGIDTWRPQTGPDGAGGTETVHICERCVDEIDAYFAQNIDPYLGVGS